MRNKIILPDITFHKYIRNYDSAWRDIAYEVNTVISRPQDKIRLDLDRSFETRYEA